VVGYARHRSVVVMYRFEVVRERDAIVVFAETGKEALEAAWPGRPGIKVKTTFDPKCYELQSALGKTIGALFWELLDEDDPRLAEQLQNEATG
jgi:hypothetical protein